MIASRYALWLLPLLAVILFIWLLGPILTPFVFAAGLAYLGDPLVDRLQTYRLSRTASVLVVFGTLTIVGLMLVLLLFPVLEHQLRTLIENMPRYLQWLQERIEPLMQTFLPESEGLSMEALRNLVAEHWGKAGGVANVIWQQAFSSGTALIALVANLVLVPVITFYLLRDWDHMVAWIRDLLPRRMLGTATELARETDEVLGQFIRGQLLVMAFLGLTYAVGLWLAGLDLAFLIGIAAGLVSFVPYLGVIVGLAASSVAMLVQTGGDLLPLLWVGLVFAVGQTLEGAVLQPLLVGDRIGLHPVTVIFAVLAGGQLFGFVGVLIALPAAAAIAVLVRYAGRVWRESRLYQDES
ncbi:AI-2E family transporter [Salinisphaera sp. P385]|uniref:AI-2E family transporter n=1 Tax=Spectribacter acetivorans TaxID=3075603 RepID=A0ABU3BA94_9GAMM|nr:AI-2E family transporter [Salinisphaera sp. P385]MDT0619392.1 AI-2E family transporter [Salinisphaera sp. P385]